ARTGRLCRRGSRLDSAAPAVARRGRRTGRCGSRLPEAALVRRVRVRLGLGRRIPPPRAALLPEAAVGGPLHAGAGHAAGSARRVVAHGSGARAARARAFVAAVVAARAVPARRRGRGAARRRADAEARRAVPLAQRRLRRLRRLSGDAGATQAQEDPRRTAQGRRGWRAPAPAARPRHRRSALGVLRALLRGDLRRASFDAVPEPGVLRAHWRSAAAAPRAGARRTGPPPDRRQPSGARRRAALWTLLGRGRASTVPALRDLLLPGDRCGDRVGPALRR